nr:PREDICTED: uncharacterized protein LOC107078705 isoform X4 [Lepisosteus oculatus]
MQRKRTLAQKTSESVPPSSKKPNKGCEEGSNPRSDGGFWARVVSAGKWFFLLVIIPPVLNYSSLQREALLLQPEGGTLIDIGLGQKIYLVCKGQGRPVVMLDASTGMSSDVWYQIQDDLSKITQVCSYDRVGLGFSKLLMENETTGMEKVWRKSTTGRMVDDLHRLIKEAKIQKPFILVGSELGALNGRFYSHIHDTYKDLVPSLQAMQFSAAIGLNRIFIILGWMKLPIRGENISEDLIQRQKYLLSNPAHQSSSVDEHFFLNESVSQVREISQYKPLSGRTSVCAITGDYFDELLPAHLNQAIAKFQKQLLAETYPHAKHIHIPGADRKMIYRKPSEVTKHLVKIVKQRKPTQESQ